MSTKTATTVTLADAGITRATCERYDVEVVTDWRGDPAIAIDDAARILREQREAIEAHEAAWAEHQAANDAWLAARSAAGHAAVKVAVECGDIKRRPGVADVHAPGGQPAWVEGAAEFERTHPRPEWNGKPTIVDAAMVAPPAPGPLARLRARVVGGDVA